MPEGSHAFCVNIVSIFIETARLEVTCIDLVDKVLCKFVLHLGINFPTSVAWITVLDYISEIILERTSFRGPEAVDI